MRKLLLLGSLLALLTIPNPALASVTTAYRNNSSFTASYPIVTIDTNHQIQEKINTDIRNTINDIKNTRDIGLIAGKLVNNGKPKQVSVTYYLKYENDNVINVMYYIDATYPDGNNIVRGFTVTYSKHTGERVPMEHYLNITLPQLQDAVKHSKAYAIDGLDNGVNLQRPIPYVSHQYFFVSDGSIGLLYQPGDLQDKSEGPGKIIIAPETIAQVNSINK